MKSSLNCIYNLSKRQLTIREEDTLGFGRDNYILPKKLKIDNIKAQIEQLVYSIINKTKTQLSFVSVNNQFKDQIKFALKKFMNDGKRMCNNPRKVALHQTLSNRAIDSDIKVCKLDKKKGVAILHTKDYYDK